MILDRDLFLELLGEFERGEDMIEGNPFDVPEIFTRDGALLVDGPIRAFLEGLGHGVPLPSHTLNGNESAFAIAGVLQGLAIGYEYAARKAAADATE